MFLMWKPLENSYNRVLYFNGEREMRELMKIIEKEKVGRDFCHRERACNSFSFSFLCPSLLF